MDDLLHMHFGLENPLPAQDPSAPIKVNNNDKDDSEFSELTPAEELTNAIATFRQWFKSNNIMDDIHPGLVENIRRIAMMFSLIPAPHHCPTPPPCSWPHQADAPPCAHLHTDNIPTPLPCVRPHHDNKDTPMEPPTPTCAYSEAASQTPAPSHEVSMPPPPPAAAASIPPASPHGCASYAGTVARNLNPAAPPFMHGPPHAPAAQPPAQAQQPVLSKHLKQLFFATRGPSHCQFFIEVLTIPSDTSLPTLVVMANRALAWAKSTLKVDSACLSPCGITCATATVPSTSDLNIIKATLSSGLLGACVSIPVSQSFIKIVDIPFFKSGTMDPFSSTEVDAQLQHSIIPSDFVVHWCYIQNSPKADSATIWIDLSNSQRGSRASTLISCTLFLNGGMVTIRGAITANMVNSRETSTGTTNISSYMACEY
ncbi:hypothetical protein P691DRAFT_769156 [Macrolepiota fuliginosa MF-IS2]|uniref:Uncharacterized protein n=1 Tax=Macrolepiota fuliginosa MF-IS2 TaxID=1400762 RepID=A0A9P6BUU0_9AGAR|nr:hypothetical protein P691DRAFT_769156 [Macrolepiota fuliginosa MF-IS2]